MSETPKEFRTRMKAWREHLERAEEGMASKKRKKTAHKGKKKKSSKRRAKKSKKSSQSSVRICIDRAKLKRLLGGKL